MVERRRLPATDLATSRICAGRQHKTIRRDRCVASRFCLQRRTPRMAMLIAAVVSCWRVPIRIVPAETPDSSISIRAMPLPMRPQPMIPVRKDFLFVPPGELGSPPMDKSRMCLKASDKKRTWSATIVRTYPVPENSEARVGSTVWTPPSARFLVANCDGLGGGQILPCHYGI